MNILLLCGEPKQTAIHRLIKTCYPDSNVTVFSDIAGAIRHIDAPVNRVDLCFTEVIMRNASGFGFVEHLRSRNRWAKVVLIAPDDRFALEGWRHGMNDYLIEPITLESIRHTMISCAPDAM